MRNAFDVAPPSDNTRFRILAGLQAFLREFWPPRAAWDWRILPAACVWNDVLARVWAEAVGLHHLRKAITALTAGSVPCGPARESQFTFHLRDLQYASTSLASQLDLAVVLTLNKKTTTPPPSGPELGDTGDGEQFA